MKDVYLSYQKKPQMEHENACKSPSEIHIVVEIRFIVSHTPNMNSSSTEDMEIRVNSRTLRPADEKRNYSQQSKSKKRNLEVSSPNSVSQY